MQTIIEKNIICLKKIERKIDRLPFDFKFIYLSAKKGHILKNHIMNKNHKQDSNINYELDGIHLTAKVIHSPYCNENIIIPRSIKSNSQEYLVTSIETESFWNSNVKSVSFPNNSALTTIKIRSFYSDLKNLYIPSSVDDLEDGWCEYTINLTDINISANNKRYKKCEKNRYLIIGKSDMKKENYDDLIFVLRSIENKSILLPDHIKNIKPFAFESCNINSIKIAEHSQLQSILANSFCNCSIESLFIPQSFEKFEDVFYACKGFADMYVYAPYACLVSMKGGKGNGIC